MKHYIITSVFLFSSLVMAAEHGVFMVVKGKVRIEDVKGAVTEAKVGSKIQVGETVVTETDSRAKIVMTDRNIINVSPLTKLKIEKYSNSASDKNVNLNLIEGKVRNNVEQKYDNKTSKFQIRTATAVAGVRGTQFITSFDKQTKVTEVVTLKGEVSFQSLNAKTGSPVADKEPVVVEKGEKSQAKEDGAPAEPVKVPEKEIKQIERETSVKNDKEKPPVAGGSAQGGPKGGETRDDKRDDKRNAGEQPLPPKPPLDELRNGNDHVKKGPAERRFEKTKVRIITQPAN